MPYLKEKAPQAQLLMDLQRTMGMRKGRYIDPDALEERHRIKNLLKEYKHVES